MKYIYAFTLACFICVVFAQGMRAEARFMPSDIPEPIEFEFNCGD